MEVKVDKSRVRSVPHSSTVLLINHFVTNTCEFMNRFSTLCENKLSTAERSIQRMEIVLSLLEAKLNSIPGLTDTVDMSDLNSAPAPAPAPDLPQPDAPPPSAAPPGAAPAGDAAPNPAQAAPAGVTEPAQAPEAAPAAAPPAENVLLNKDAPMYALYFRLIRVGVPEGSVKQKMQAEGVDPTVLDRPDEPATGAAAQPLPEDDDSDSD